MRREEAEVLSFPFIMVSGPRSAYPHGGAKNRKIRRGEFKTTDMGAYYKENRTDITRTFVVRTPSDRQKEIY